MKRLKAYDITVSFNGHTVILTDENDRQKTSEGVELWIQQKPANNVRPMASIPDGTLDQFKHCRPKIISLRWENETEAR